MRDRIVTQDRQPAALQRDRVDRVTDDQHPQRQCQATRAREPLRPAPARELAGADLGERHRRVGSDDAQVGGEQQLRAGADRGTVPHRDRRRGEGGEERRGVAQAGGGRNPWLLGPDAVGRAEQERARGIVGEVVERREQAGARGTADVGERSGREVDRGDAGDVPPPAQPPTRARASTSARSSSVRSQAVVAAALARTCSGEVAPAITLPTLGTPASHDSASSGSV